jgi:hypothetical protein
MPKIELLPIETAILEFQLQQKIDFFDNLLDDPTRDILVYRGDYHHSGNLSIADLNPENLVNVDGIIINGNLSVTGTISNYIHRVKDRKDCGLELLVTGSMTLHNLISTNATISVCQNLTAETIYGTSALKVDRILQAKALLINDEHRCDINECEIEYEFDLYECDYAEICQIFSDRVISEEDTKLDHDRLIQMLESGQNIFR